MPKPEDSSLPIHIGQTIVDAMFELKHEVGALGGKIDGLHTSVGDLHGRVSQCMTRDECAAIVKGHRRVGPSGELPKRDWWGAAQKKVAVIAGTLVILGTLGGASYWMFSAYNAIERTRVDIHATAQNAAGEAAFAARTASREAAVAAEVAARAAAAAAAKAVKDITTVVDRAAPARPNRRPSR